MSKVDMDKALIVRHGGFTWKLGQVDGSGLRTISCEHNGRFRKLRNGKNRWRVVTLKVGKQVKHFLPDDCKEMKAFWSTYPVSSIQQFRRKPKK